MVLSQNNCLNACILSAQNAHAPVHARLCNSAVLLCHRSYCEFILSLVRASCRLSNKNHSIIRVGAGLIQFVYCSHSKRGHGAHTIQKFYFRHFSRKFCTTLVTLILALFFLDQCPLSRWLLDPPCPPPPPWVSVCPPSPLLLPIEI